MEKAMRDHFFKHGRPEAKKADKDTCHWCQLRSFSTHKKLPITVSNTVDKAVLNPNFRFIEHSILADDVEVADDAFRAGCGCADDEECMYSSCLCLEEMAPDSSEEDETADGAGMAPRRKRFAYHSHGAKAGLLRSRILHSREPIYECHAECSCTARCPNRVVERGRTVPLEIFRTDDRGWGVRSPVDIQKGQFVDLYLGEVITHGEANRRRAASSIAQRKDIYLFALDKFADPDSPDQRLRGPPLEVDGEFMSGPTRFVNHSCDPNMRIFARIGDHADKPLHDLAFFAIQDIPRMEELTFDYVDGLEEMGDDAHDPTKVKDMTRCLCGTAKCRGFLW